MNGVQDRGFSRSSTTFIRCPREIPFLGPQRDSPVCRRSLTICLAEFSAHVVIEKATMARTAQWAEKAAAQGNINH